jgi:hypothetical protein
LSQLAGATSLTVASARTHALRDALSRVGMSDVLTTPFLFLAYRGHEFADMGGSDYKIGCALNGASFNA